MTSRLLSPALFLTLFVFACAPSLPAAPSRDGVQALDDRDAALVALKAASGPLALRDNPRLGTVAFLELTFPQRINFSSSLSIGTATRDFVLRYRSLFGLGPADTLETKTTTTDQLGLRHVSYVQKRYGVTIWGSCLDAHLRGVSAASADLLRLFGHLHPLPALTTADSQPQLASEAARQLALTTARTAQPTADLSAYVPALYYLADDTRLHLVHRVEVYGQNDGLPVRAAYFIDAHDGSVRRREDLVAHVDMTVPAQGSGTGALGTSYSLSISQRGDSFSLQDPTRGSQRTTRVSPTEKLPGRTLTSDRADSWDDDDDLAAPGLAVDVHAHMAALWDYFATQHGYFGWDGGGHGLVGVAHLGAGTNLALFDGERLLFGDGDGRDFSPLGAAFDIVAHEYVHAVTRATAALATEDESGQLDEGLADLFAALIEHHLRPSTPAWTIGEEIFHPAGQPGALADLTDANSPSGRIGYAGYLLAQRLGAPRTASIVFRAITVYLFRYAALADAKDAFFAAARDLFAGDDDVTNALDASFSRAGL